MEGSKRTYAVFDFVIILIIAISIYAIRTKTVSGQVQLPFSPPTAHPLNLPPIGNNPTPNQTDIANNWIMSTTTIYPTPTSLVIAKKNRFVHNAKGL